MDTIIHGTTQHCHPSSIEPNILIEDVQVIVSAEGYTLFVGVGEDLTKNMTQEEDIKTK